MMTAKSPLMRLLFLLLILFILFFSVSCNHELIPVDHRAAATVNNC